ncbi:heavy metal translocating P-type ATPase [Methanobacterium ferruginis]|uniref:heavy metal translocating P-type ATPase n=1 Tax=Methanobacterium ferruginis TaxID=710191 RepID=UPI0025732967|nr:cation-translocating P-type ATPase [Methanobacterium ferruginis]BDZ67672.1 copper-translocating P-type ATPase [Methanobacterium ferruginis]
MTENHEHSTEEADTPATCSCCGGDIFQEKPPLWKQKPLLIICTSAAIFTIALILEKFFNQGLLAEIAFLVVVAVAGYEVITGAFKGLLKLHFNMNLLITIAAIGAFLIGHGEEGAAVILLFYVAEFLEDYASERARNSIAALLKLAPETAHVLRKGQELEVHAHSVQLDEKVVIRPGDKIPLDGMVVKGSSAVDQSPITGESIPVTKKSGDEVFAGTINTEGYLEVKVTRKSDETIISRIIELVRESKDKKSKTESFIDRFATYYTPTVILLAIAVAIIPPFLWGVSFDDWFYRALVLLVVSCPCALAISTPVSMVSGITSATRNGVLIKGGEYVEEMKNVKAVVFDKTGTLTEGRLEVTDIFTLNGNSLNDTLRVSASLESHSKHPLAKAILKKAKECGVELEEVHNFKSITGTGLKGKIRGNLFYIGNESLFKDTGLFKDEDFPLERIRKLEEEGKTTVLLGNEQEIMGLIILMDKIRDDAGKTVEFLKKNGIKTIMLTGDNQGTARGVASQLGLDEYYHGLMPEDKVEKIDELVESHGHVAMVGDGINDAPALAKANIGIAMGAAGSDVAIETADVALMNDDLAKIEYLVKLSRKTMSVVRENVTLSILVKTSFAILAVLGFITLWMAVGIGDMGLSLTVIINALRIGSQNFQ